MVTCEICKKQMNWIQNTHLKQHGITLEEYRAKYPNCPTKTEQMTDTIQKTRWGNHKPVLPKCARKECDSSVKTKNNKYCSNYCRSKTNYRDTLGHFATPHGNPGYVNGDYMQCRDQKRLAYDRDKGCCVKCNKVVDGKCEQYGVHHLIPRRLIEDKGVADSLRNLVTLCNKHHKEIESMFADHIFKLYVNHDSKSLEDLMNYLRSNI